MVHSPLYALLPMQVLSASAFRGKREKLALGGKSKGVVEEETGNGVGCSAGLTRTGTHQEAFTVPSSPYLPGSPLIPCLAADSTRFSPTHTPHPSQSVPFKSHYGI
ncbi:hypothetical protein M0804_009090 [Polistes exclamans]|nr:hypothetical protein M0804_009090 [Polistes exclamans]